jgi:ureidoacrylate peracid hydrolase
MENPGFSRPLVGFRWRPETSFLEGFNTACRAGICRKARRVRSVIPVFSGNKRRCLAATLGRIIKASIGEAAMHKIAISQSVIDRVVARRGKEHIFENLVPSKTALVVVDMQNGFMVPELGHAACAMAHEIVPNINRLAKAVRDTGGAVIWIQTAYSDETLTSWSISYEMVGQRGAERRKFSLSPQNKGYEIFPDLKVEPTDLIVVKNRYSAFIQGSSNIEDVLKSHGLDTLLITGTVTNVCCESTARDAMMRNYRTIMITDGNAANSDEDHNAALNNFYLTFGDVMSTDFVTACLRRNAQKGLAAAE